MNVGVSIIPPKIHTHKNGHITFWWFGVRKLPHLTIDDHLICYLPIKIMP